MCKCGNIAAAPLFTHYYKQKTAEKQVIGGKSAVDKGKFFCERPWSQIVELSTVFPFPSPARAEELPRSARRRAVFRELSRKSPKLSTKSNNCTARSGGRVALCAPALAAEAPFCAAAGGKRGRLMSAPGKNALPAAGDRRECPAPSSLFPVTGGKGARTAVVFAVSLARRRRI